MIQGESEEDRYSCVCTSGQVYVFHKGNYHMTYPGSMACMSPGGTMLVIYERRHNQLTCYYPHAGQIKATFKFPTFDKVTRRVYPYFLEMHWFAKDRGPVVLCNKVMCAWDVDRNEIEYYQHREVIRAVTSKYINGHVLRREAFTQIAQDFVSPDSARLVSSFYHVP